MRALYLRNIRDDRDDRGSIILALLGIIILTTVASVGLSAIVTGQHQSRHDNSFTQSLNNAESGIDAMVANIKGTADLNDPSLALTYVGSKAPKLTQSGQYTVSASPVNSIGSTGNAASTVWFLTSTGTSVVQGQTIARTITEQVTIAHTYNAPLDGKAGLTLGGTGNAVNNCTVCTGPASNNSNPQQIAPGVTCSGITSIVCGALSAIGIGSAGSVTVSDAPKGATPGGAETGGTLVMQGGDVGNFAQVALDGSGASCIAANGCGVSGSSVLAQQSTPPPNINTPGCAPGMLGADLNGLPLVLPDPLGVVLTTNLTVKLNQQPPISNTICTNLPIIVPSLQMSLSSLPLIGNLSQLTGLDAALDAPIGADCLTGGPNGTLANLLDPGNMGDISCTMDPPEDLIINQMATTDVPIYLGTGGTLPNYVSAEINSPNGTCTITGNVVLYGTINCLHIVVPAGSSLTVNYPTDDTSPTMTGADTQHTDSVSYWNETH
jgi:hypothetical protein